MVAELKRIIKYAPKLILVGAVFGVIIFAALLGGSLLFEDKASGRIPIAMVVQDDFEQNKIALSIFESIELNDEALNIQYVDEAQAFELLKAGDLIAGVFIPENFVQDIMTGKNTPAKVVVGKDAGIETLLFRQAAEAGALLLKSSQSGVYAISDNAVLSGVRQEQMDTIIDEINWKYISLALAQNAIMDTVDMNTSKGMSLKEYLGSSGVLLLLILMGTAIAGMLRRGDGDFFRCLIRKNVNGPWIAFCKLSVIFLTQLAFSVALIVLMNFIFSLDIDGMTLVKTLPVILTVATLQLVLLYAVKSPVASVLLQFGVGIFMLFMAGGIIPAEFLPLGLTEAAQWFPIAPALEQMCYALTGAGQALAGCMLWSGALFLIGVGLIIRKIRRA